MRGLGHPFRGSSVVSTKRPPHALGRLTRTQSEHEISAASPTLLRDLPAESFSGYFIRNDRDGGDMNGPLSGRFQVSTTLTPFQNSSK
jgi:hypothetical protein